MVWWVVVVVVVVTVVIVVVESSGELGMVAGGVKSAVGGWVKSFVAKVSAG